jgi:uncharacterized protein
MTQVAQVLRGGRAWPRWLELVSLYGALPLALALALPPAWLFPVLLAVTLLAAALLTATPGFAWRDLVRGWRGLDWRHVAAVGLAALTVSAALVWWLVPYQALFLPRRETGLWLLIMLLYPFLSALPQEIVFRELFFRRYGALFAGPRSAILVNGFLFGAAHLIFWNWVAVALSAAGGMVFAHGWHRGGFAMAVVLHALCGAIIFTIGLGTFFYHGAVPAR